MLTRTISYQNFNGEDKVLIAHFHLGKADITRIAADPTFLNEMNAAVANQDTKTMLAKIEELVRLSYGIRSEDGERFVKNKEVQDAFIQSAAYEEFIMDLVAGDGKSFNSFIQGVFPPKLMEMLAAKIKSGEVEDPFKNLPNPESNKGEPATEETIAAAKFNDFGKPAVVEDKFHDESEPEWVRQNRIPTQAELVAMPRDEMLRAVSKYPEIVTG